MRVNLVNALNAALSVADNEWDDSSLHVSDLSTPTEGCPRQLWLRLRGAQKKKPTPGQLLMFRHGNRIHRELIEDLRVGLGSEWEIIAVEKPVEFEGIIGRCDCLLQNVATKEIIVVDFKSVRGRKFGHLDAQGKSMDSHDIQVQGYSYGFTVSAVCEPVCGIVLYTDREGQNGFRQYDDVPNDFQAVKDAIVEIKTIAGLSEAPPLLEPELKININKRDDSVELPNRWQCDYCDYCDISCHGALPKELRSSGIVAYRNDDGLTNIKKTKKEEKVLCSEEMLDFIRQLYAEGKYQEVERQVSTEQEKEAIPF